MSATPHELVKPDRSVVYRVADGHPLELHLFEPRRKSAADRRRCVLFIHGGGWQNGAPSQFFAHAKACADRSIFACSAAYRLSSVAPFPAALIDCREAVAYLRRNADELGIEPNAIAAFGSSSGGHLAAFLGITGTEPSVAALEPGAPSPQVDLVVNVHGVADLADATEAEYRTRFVGVSFAEDPAAWHRASPINYVSATSAPMLLLHDPNDEVVAFDQSVRLTGTLERQGVDAELVRLSGTRHGFVYQLANEKAREAYESAMAWLGRRW